MSGKCLYFNGLNVFKNGLNYCVDMLRLSCQITVDFFETKIASRKVVYKDFLSEWTSTRLTDFYHNFNYSDDDCSFWFGFISNKEKSCERKSLSNPKTTFNLTIEFNPNKVKNNSLLLHILSLSNAWVVKSCDFAIDVCTNIVNICGFDKGRKDCFLTYDCGGDNKTFYIGKRDNRVKVYNKTIESGFDYDLTRIEITKYLNDLPLKDVPCFVYDGYLPELFIKEFQLSFEDLKGDKTLFALVYAVTNGYPLHDLSRDYKKKVKNFLQNKKPILIDFKCISDCLRKYIYYYFPSKIIYDS